MYPKPGCAISGLRNAGRSQPDPASRCCTWLRSVAWQGPVPISRPISTRSFNAWMPNATHCHAGDPRTEAAQEEPHHWLPADRGVGVRGRTSSANRPSACHVREAVPQHRCVSRVAHTENSGHCHSTLARPLLPMFSTLFCFEQQKASEKSSKGQTSVIEIQHYSRSECPLGPKILAWPHEVTFPEPNLEPSWPSHHPNPN